VQRFEKQRGHALIQIQNAVVVVAHPDDEILWFSSILHQCKSVLVCFGPSATSKASWDSGRAVVMETYPLTKVRFLKIRQADAFEAANWTKPKEARSGLQLRRRRRRTNSLYESNAEKLLRILEVELKHESLVFTHNPWGEYGHEEHVQVFRVLTVLKEKLGFDLFVTSYVGNRSLEMMSRCLHSLEGKPLMRETNRMLAQKLKTLYLENNCWTWEADYKWPEYEYFYRVDQPNGGTELGASVSLPLNYITQNFIRSPIRIMAGKALPTFVRAMIRTCGWPSAW
jgi:LmbE family N-acetylglucosaminyl deacetylase